jgi:hypothetical protein
MDDEGILGKGKCSEIISTGPIEQTGIDIWLLDSLLCIEVQEGLQSMAVIYFLQHVFENLFDDEPTGLKKADYFRTNVANTFPFSCLRRSAEYSIICVYEHIRRFSEALLRRTGKAIPFKIYRLDDLKCHRTFYSHPLKGHGNWEKTVMNQFVAEERQYKDFEPELLWGVRASILAEGSRQGHSTSVPLDIPMSAGMLELCKLVFKLSAKSDSQLFADQTLVDMLSAFLDQFKSLTIRKYEEGKVAGT